MYLAQTASTGNTNYLLVTLAEYSVVFFLSGLFFLILWKLVTGHIDINNLINEASQNVSRFQMLVFTCIYGVSVFVVTISSFPPRLPDVPIGFIYLMAASYGVYFLDKSFNLVAHRRQEKTSAREGAGKGEDDDS